MEYGDFQDIDFNNTQGACHIRSEYSTQFLQNSTEETQHNQIPSQDPEPKTIYYLPEPEYYNSDIRPRLGTTYQNPHRYLPPPLVHRTYNAGTEEKVGAGNIDFNCIVTSYLARRLTP